MSRWRELDVDPEGYAARFAAMAESGESVHGEADFVERLVEPGARVLDAGCGTGRIAVRLAEGTTSPGSTSTTPCWRSPVGWLPT